MLGDHRVESADNDSAVTLPSEVEIYLNLLAGGVSSILGEQLVGTYLHGSAVLGGFNPKRSDLDVLVVVSGTLTPGQKLKLGTDLSSQTLPVPAETLEMSVITLGTAQVPTNQPAYELHINTLDEKAADGSGKSDPDLILHIPVARQSGRILGTGQSPRDVFGVVLRELVLTEMIHELRTAPEAAQVTPQYLILNACRNIAYLDEGRFYSKMGGGRWFVNHHRELDAEIVEAAIIRQAAPDEAVAIDLGSAISFAGTMADRLQKSLG